MTEPEHSDEPLDPADEEGPVGGGYTGGIRDLINRVQDDEDSKDGQG
ncbi:hypothetical protein ACPZ19_25305 [Amycolatopsis lurida]